MSHRSNSKLAKTGSFSIVLSTATLMCICGCVQKEIPRPVNPSLEYSNYVKAQAANGVMPARGAFQSTADVAQARAALSRNAAVAPHIPSGPPTVQYVDGDYREPRVPPTAQLPTADRGYEEYRNPEPQARGYTGPLAYGDPGMTASLWRESRSENDLFRDHRAYQPMDLITVKISESSEATKDANTETKSESEVSASIEELFGLEKYIPRINKNADPANLIKAATANDFKGEGTTDRKGSLRGTLSAMVIEVLPSGILRIEGEKIIAVNSEEETMVLSGLVRPRDINSSNEVDSAKIASLRIDYYGKGTLGEAQYGGWLGRIMRVVWPF